MKKHKKNVLFVCSKNKWRSRTAETIFKDSPQFNVKSAGTSSTSKVRINQKLIEWSDEIFVMEEKHKLRLEQNFKFDSKKITVLHIPDIYPYMDPELISELKMVLI